MGLESSCAGLFNVATLMLFDFDPRKDALNRAKHGFWRELAQHLTWDQALTWKDDRYHYAELQMAGLVPAGDRLYYVVFVEHGERYRMISLRHANGREIKHYVENFP